MSRRPHLILCGLSILALAGLPRWREPQSRLPDGPWLASVEASAVELEMRSLAEEIESRREGLKDGRLVHDGLSLPHLCDQAASALAEIGERAQLLRADPLWDSANLDQYEETIQEPLVMARVELQLLEVYGLQVMDLVQAQQRMRAELSRGKRGAALAIFRAQPRGEFDLDAPELVGHLLAQLDELAFLARNQRGPGLRDQRTY